MLTNKETQHSMTEVVRKSLENLPVPLTSSISSCTNDTSTLSLKTEILNILILIIDNLKVRKHQQEREREMENQIISQE